MIEQERAARYSDFFVARREQHEATCTNCPFCAALRLVRNTRPEVVDHLTTAARELVAAAALVLDELGEIVTSPSEARADEAGEAPPDNVRRIPSP